MKKILIILTLLSSFAFSEYFQVTENKYYDSSLLNSTSLYGGFYDVPTYNKYDVVTFHNHNYYVFSHYDAIDMGGYYKYNVYVFKISEYDLLNGIAPTCDPNTEIEVDGNCEVIGEQGSCDDYYFRDNQGSCTLEIINYRILNEDTDEEIVSIQYADGSSMFYTPFDGTGWRYDLDGNDLDLLEITLGEYKGVTPISNYEKMIDNGIGKVLQVVGAVLYMAGTNETLQLLNIPSPTDFNPSFIAGVGSMVLSQALVTPEKIVTQTNADGTDNDPDTSDTIFSGVQIITTKSSEAIDLEDSESVPTSSTQDEPVDINDNYKAVKNYSDDFASSWGGVGELGDVVYISKKIDNLAITQTDEEIKILKQNDDSVDVATVKKTDLANSIKGQTNGLAQPDEYNDVEVKVKNVTKPQINNDGSVTQTTTPKATVTNSPSKNYNETTNSDGSSTVAQAPITTPSNSNPTTAPIGDDEIDLSGVTKRLDTVSNQMTKANSYLSNIKLNGDTTNSLLTNILNGDKEYSNDSSVSDYIDSTYSSFKSQYDNVQSQVNDAITVIEGKSLSSVLSDKVVTTCPKTFNFYITQSLSKDFDIDPCTVLSQSKEYMYTFSYIGFSAMFISFFTYLLIKV